LHVVEADRRHVGAPDPPPFEADRRVCGAQAVEERARADRQIGEDEQQPDQQRGPVDGGQVVEELADGVEERADALAERGREHVSNVREAARATGGPQIRPEASSAAKTAAGASRAPWRKYANAEGRAPAARAERHQSSTAS